MPTLDSSSSWSAQSSTSYEQVGVNPSTGSLSTGSVVTLTRSRTGTRLAHWRKIIADGGNATTGLTAQWDSVECDKSNEVIIEETVSKAPSQWYKRTTRHVGFLPVIEYGAGRAVPSSPTLSSTVAENRASAAFYKKLRSQAVIMSGPTFLGELRETLHMLRRPAAALWDKNLGYLDALSKAKRASPKHWLKTVSGLWLEHSFGWMPLINDTLDAAKAYRSLGKPRSKVISAGAIDYADKTSTLTWGNGIYAAGSTSSANHRAHRVRSTAIDTCICRFKGKITAQAETATWSNWDAFGFTPSEFVPTAWELLPWSFLVDYFTNVGDCLSAAVTDRSSVVFANKTVIRSRRWYGNVVPAATANGSPATTVVNSGIAGFNINRRLVTRSAGTGVPLPVFHFESSLSNGQLFNIAALLGQARALHQQQSPRNWHR